jgi:SPP1 gp7 family putative phage head morphogenesis protein
VLAPLAELDRFSERSAEAFTDALGALAKAILRRDGSQEDAERGLGSVLASTQAMADLLGRRRLILEADASRARGGASATFIARQVARHRRVHYADLIALPIPKISAEDAIADLVEREPRLAVGAEEVRRVYDEEHGFALARSTSITLTERIRDLLVSAQRRGDAPGDVVADILDLADADVRQSIPFLESYAETVYRTNMSSAYAAGRFRMALSEDGAVSDVIRAFRFTATGDADTRDNHAAADGFIAEVTDNAWNFMSPPFGYNCRCALELVDRFELDRLGRLDELGRLVSENPPRGAHPDEGFRPSGFGRPDRAIYGGSSFVPF